MTDTRLIAICASAAAAVFCAAITGFGAFVLTGVLYTRVSTANAQAAAPADVYRYALVAALSVALLTAFFVAPPTYRLFASRERD